MNRAAAMLEVLRDGKAHSRRDLFERCGFFLTNNAASELRSQGHDVRQSRERVNGDNVYFYTLHGSLEEPDPIEENETALSALTADGGSGSSSESDEWYVGSVHKPLPTPEQLWKT